VQLSKDTVAATSRASAPREAGERFLGVQDAGEVLEYGTKRGSAGSGFRGTDQEVERGGFRIGGRGAKSDRHAMKLTA